MAKLFFQKNNFTRFKKEISKCFPLYSADINTNYSQGKISVILPVFNCEEYLKESIDSVLCQSYPNLELIIVDDGSTDLSGQIADSYLKIDSRVKVIHQKNMKLPAALNNGFKLAKGEFLTWTSADNRMLPHCLETLASELIRDRTCDMVFGNMKLIDKNGSTIRGYGWYELPPLSGNVILPDSPKFLNTVANNTIGAAFLYRSGAAAVLSKYCENLFTLEDYDYFMRMNSIFSIKHTLSKKPIYEYRIHKASLTSRDEEIGITSSRPALMKAEEQRRKFYLENTRFYIDCPNNIKIYHKFDRVLSVKAADKIASSKYKNIGYINIGNVPQSWTPPPGIPKILINDFSSNAVFDFDITICGCSINNICADNCVFIKNEAERYSFISLFTKEFIINKILFD